jgi:ribosomal subunit interface protein
MTFGSIVYKHNNLEETKLLTTLVDQKFQTLKKFIAPQSVILCEVEFEKVGGHQHGRIYRVETNLSVNGTLYRAEATEDNFEKAIDVVRSELDSELGKAKDKNDTLSRKAGRMFKSLLVRS